MKYFGFRVVSSQSVIELLLRRRPPSERTRKGGPSRSFIDDARTATTTYLAGFLVIARASPSAKRAEAW